MATEDQQPEGSETQEALDPNVIPMLGPSLLNEEYDTAITKLKDVFSNNKWEDKEVAAQNFATLTSSLNKIHGIEPEVKLNADAGRISLKILDETLDQDSKIAAVEDWRKQQKQNLFNTDDPDLLVAGNEREKLIDQYATELRRGIVGKDRGFIADSLARGAEAALSPILGTTDLLLGTNSKERFHQKALEYEDPARDGSLVATTMGVVGGVGGFTVAALNPVTAFGYLGATLVDQAKSVYDTTLQETGSEEAALSALQQAAPGIAIGTFADRLVGGSLGQILKGRSGFVGAVTGSIAGAAGNAIQGATTGSALAIATGNKQFEPTAESVGIEALAGGLVGGAVGAVGHISAARKVHPQETAERVAHRQIQQNIGDVSPIGETQTESFASHFLQRPEATRTATTSADVEGTLLDSSTPQQTREAAFAPENQADSTEALLPETQGQDNYAKLIPVDFEAAVPQPFVMELVRQLDSSASLQDIQGAFGFYEPGTNRVAISRQVFKDLPQAYKTFAHEIGHLIDFAGRREGMKEELQVANPDQEPIINKLVRFNEALQGQFDAPRVAAEARALSAEWRPGWEGAPEVPDAWKVNPPPPEAQDYKNYYWLNYRNSPTEIQADTISAVLNNPKHVQETYPLLWDAFEKGLETQPAVKKFWNDAQEITQSPERFVEWQQGQMEEGRRAEALIVQKSAEEVLLETKNKEKGALGRAKDDLRRKVVNRFGTARDILESKSGAAREEAAQEYNKLYSHLKSSQEIESRIDTPVKKLLTRYDGLGIEGSPTDRYSTWKNYERWNRTLNETSPTMEAIKSNEVGAKENYQIVNDYVQDNLQRYGLESNPLNKLNVSEKTGQDLVDELAKTHLYLPKDIRSKVQDALIRNGNIDAAALLDNSAFNVRRYLGNPDVDVNTALKSMALLKSKLGPDKFAALQKVSEDFHDTLGNYLFEVSSESGIFSPELLKRMKLNKNNYVTYNVLKYFQEDPKFKGTIRQQYGTIDKIGDELAATIAKTKAVIARAEYQNSQNAAIGIARAGEVPMRVVDIPPRKGVYDVRDEMQAASPDKSYLIQFDEGKPSLYEIDSPNFAKMFESSTLQKNPTISYGLGLIDKFNKVFLERELKTLFSLPYAVSQRFIDRSNEAILARSKELPGVPFHVSKPLREINREARQLNKQLEQGVFAPEIKEMLDTNAIGFHLADAYANGEDGAASAENAVYEALGVKIPGEEQAFLADRVNKKLHGIIENIGFGEFKPFKLTKELAERDERIAKISAYLIGRKIRNMGPNEAAILAREYAGTPDPFGGGTEATPINKLILFGRAHVAGMRAIANQLKEDPSGYLTQYMYRKFVPRMLVSSAIMAPLISTLFGEEEGKKYKAFLDKIPSFDKLSKMIIPLGFTDENGQFRGFEANSKDINDKWKASYLRLPFARELVSVDTMFNPGFKALEELIDTGGISVKHITQDVAQSLGSTFLAQSAPLIMSGIRTGQLIGGYNPYDYYRNKGILPKDVQEAGTFMQKTYQYLLWSGAQTFPGVFSGNFYKQSSTEPLDAFDYLSRVPFVGSNLRRFVGETNYGDLEQSLKQDQQKVERDAEIRLNLQDNSKALLEESRKTDALVSRLGAGWEKQVSQKTVERVHLLNNWKARVYRHSFNELRAAFDKADEEALDRQSDALERVSSDYLKLLEEKK